MFVKLGVPAGFDLEKAALDGANLMKTRLIWDKSVMTNKVFTIPKTQKLNLVPESVKFLKEFSVRTPTKANMAPETGPWK